MKLSRLSFPSPPLRYLLAGISTTLVILTIVGVTIGYACLAHLSSSVDLVDGPMPGIYRAANIRDMVLMEQAYILRCTYESAADCKGRLESIAAIRTRITEEMTAYRAAIHEAQDRETFNGMALALKASEDTVDRMVDLAKAGEIDGLKKLASTDWEQKNDALDSGLADVVLWNKKYGDRVAEAAIGGARTGMRLLMAAGLSSVVAGVFLSLALVRSVRRRLRPIGEVVERIGQGDFSARVAIPVQDEIGAIGVALNRSLDDMSYLVRTIRQTAGELNEAGVELVAFSDQVREGSSKTAEASGFLSNASETISSNMTSVAAAMEQMRVSILEIARTASSAATLSRTANVAATTARSSLGELNAASLEIRGVVEVIGALAAQTNLLALNATIEAARAGEAGRGFAVVAGEVKDLARRTTEANNGVNERMAAMLSQSDHTARSITEIASVIQNVSDYSNAIAAAVEEQTATTTEVCGNISSTAGGACEMSRRIGDVAAIAATASTGAENGGATVERVRLAASDLDKLVSRFRLPDDIATLAMSANRQ